MELSENKKKWIEAFSEEGYVEQIKNLRNIIEKELSKFVENYKVNNPYVMMFESMESRIKSKDSFSEKLDRKGYLGEWRLSDDMLSNQKYIMDNLPDLIGYRISCYFVDDEKKIYDALLMYKFSNIIFDPSTNIKQDNGHTIYKVDGKYKDKDCSCCFEVQIKALVHNVWGEIEHKTIYKRRNYDFNISERKAITESTYDILFATDKQLNSLHSMGFDKDKLIKGIYFEYTKEDIAKSFETRILGKIYNVFFDVFYQSFKKEIAEFAALSILSKKTTKVKVVYEAEKKYIDMLSAKIENTFSKYDINVLFSISKILFELDDINHFYALLISVLVPKKDDEFGDESDFYEEDTNIEDSVSDDIKNILVMLKEFGLKEVKHDAK